MSKNRVRVTWEFRTKHQWAEVTCRVCGWRVIFPGESVEWLFRPPVPLDRARGRFRCRGCGKREAELRALTARAYHG